MMYAHQDADGWHIQTVDIGGGFGNGIAIDHEDNPHLVYSGYGDSHLLMAVPASHAPVDPTPIFFYLPVVVK